MLPSKLFYSQGMDSELFLLVKQNDAKAFEELYQRYWPALINTAYKKLESRQKAEAVVQNIFIDLYNGRNAIDLPISLSAYLNEALKFKLLSEYRADIIQAKYQQYLFFSTICKNDLATDLEGKELELKISKTLNALSVECEQVFLLSRKENLSNRDIAEALNIKIEAVENHLSNALKTLKQQL